MPPEADQGNSGQGQEPGAGNQSQGQEPGSQQGQQDASQQGGGQGQEPGQTQTGNQGGSGPEDITKMTPEQLQTYAAKLQKDLGQTRTEAARHRTALQEAQRAQMSEQEKVAADLTEAQTTLQERETRIQELEGRVEDLTKGASLREALGQAGAINPQTAFKVGTWSDVKLNQDGTVEPESFKAAVQALKTSDPYLFRRGASADAGAGAGSGGAPEGGSSINDFVRGRTAR